MKGQRMKWIHNQDEQRWELVAHEGGVASRFVVTELPGFEIEHMVVVCAVSDAFVAGMEIGEPGLRVMLHDENPDWPTFPDAEKRRNLKAKGSL